MYNILKKYINFLYNKKYLDSIFSKIKNVKKIIFNEMNDIES